MREIKFRVWDKKRGSFHWGLGNVCMSLGGHLMWQFGFKAPDILDKEECENYDVQQYIGIKDKNGKEIYEGDLVSNSFSDVQVVEYNGCQWDCRLIKKATEHWPAQYLHCEYMHWEVIGNIYKNPELLKEVAK